MSSTLLEQGLELMLFGMGTVFVFLTLLIVVTGWMSSLAQRLEPPPAAPLARKRRGAPESQPSPAVVAAISAAIHEYRKDSRH